MEPPSVVFTLLSILALIAANAFFVAAEFALIAVRRPTPDSASGLLASSRPTADLALTAQLGSSTTSLLLGYVVAVATSHWLHASETPVFSLLGERVRVAPLVAVAVALGMVVALHVVLGQQLPKALATRRAEWIASRVTLLPLRLLALLLRPATWLLSRCVNGIARLFGASAHGVHPLVHTPEEIRMLVAQSHEQGVVEEDEREMIRGVFEFTDTVAREVMTPRTGMVAVPVNVTLDALLETAVAEGHSRLPVYGESLDDILGILLVKDLLHVLRARPTGAFDVRRLMREPYFVPDTKPVDDLLAEFREQSIHLAIVLDEFGGTYGLVTLEDLLEEIVGEINDEHDLPEPAFADTPEGDVLIDGGTSIGEVNERFGLALPEADFDTLGGYIFGALGRVPTVGDIILASAAEGEAELRVEATDERRVTLVRLARTAGFVRGAAPLESPSV